MQRATLRALAAAAAVTTTVGLSGLAAPALASHSDPTVPEGATQLRWRYSTDAAYLDSGWFIDGVAVNGTPATVSSDDGWVETDGKQTNNWTVQVISRCDLTLGVEPADG